jgi:30S ribosomal protein S31
MGKGDLRTRRGKIYNGSYGKTRPRTAPKKKAAEQKPMLRSSAERTERSH